MADTPKTITERVIHSLGEAVEHFKKGIASFSMQGAAQQVHHWQKLLEEQPQHTQRMQLAGLLGELHNELTSSHPAAENLRRLLTHLAQEAGKAAHEAEGALATQLKALAKALEHAVTEIK